jgi:Ser-tRNA(Ala) deacylase AlaX
MSSATTALYQRDETLRKHDTKVVSVQPFVDLSETERALFKQAPQEDAHAVVTAETIFYAQGGGQPSDSGTMSYDSGTSF